MENLFKDKKFRIFLQWLVLAVLVGVLGYTLWQITAGIGRISPSGMLHRRYRPQVNTQTQVSQIQTWMTFRYLNVVFRLPSAYLQTGLGISDKRYPNISINTLAKEKAQPQAAELLLVQKQIQNYFKLQPSATSTP